MRGRTRRSGSSREVGRKESTTSWKGNSKANLKLGASDKASWQREGINEAVIHCAEKWAGKVAGGRCMQQCSFDLGSSLRCCRVDASCSKDCENKCTATRACSIAKVRASIKPMRTPIARHVIAFQWRTRRYMPSRQVQEG